VLEVVELASLAAAPLVEQVPVLDLALTLLGLQAAQTLVAAVEQVLVMVQTRRQVVAMEVLEW
jgi:hypothetical protein